MADIFLAEHLVVDVHDAAAGISENRVGVFFVQGPKEDLRSGQFHFNTP